MSNIKSRECQDCGEQIPAGRLKAVPNAVKCVDCLEASGDTFRYKAFPGNLPSKTISGSEICRSKGEYERIKQKESEMDYSILSRGGISSGGEC